MENENVRVSRVASRPYWREDDARVIVEAWRRSGETLAGFARRHGVDPQRLARWDARLKQAKPVASTAPSPLRFHPVRLARSTQDTGWIEIELPDGPRVRVSHGFDADVLRRVLDVLGGRPTC